MKKLPKTLIIASTHGDELMGIEVIEQLQRLGYGDQFDVLIANPKALSKRVRFTEKDLNRSYPGNNKSKYYEERVAYHNLQIAKRYQYILDIHEASSGINDFIIIPKNKLTKNFPLQLINLNTILLWPDPKGPMGEILPNVIELEFGVKSKNRSSVCSKATKIIAQFLSSISKNKPKPGLSERQNIFYVYDKLLEDKKNKNLKDFKLTTINKESFYPLLVGQYSNLGIACYKMRKIK